MATPARAARRGLSLPRTRTARGPPMPADLVQRFIRARARTWRARVEAHCRCAGRFPPRSRATLDCAGAALRARRRRSRTPASAGPNSPTLDWRGAGLAIEARPTRRRGPARHHRRVLRDRRDRDAGHARRRRHADRDDAAARHARRRRSARGSHRGRHGGGVRLDPARARTSLPRAVNLISGPSRTGDIEQTIVLGAHGPYRVHIIVLKADRLPGGRVSLELQPTRARELTVGAIHESQRDPGRTTTAAARVTAA